MRNVRLKWFVTSSLLLLTVSTTTTAADPLMQKALESLQSTGSGKVLLERASAFWKAKSRTELLNHFKWGPASRTDVVLTRSYDPGTGQESREREVTVYLKKTNSLRELVLDMAHELVHATSRPAWDPYDPSLTAGKYIWAALEGEGGEVEAVISECHVSSELQGKEYRELYKKRCADYVDSSSQLVDRTKVRQDFYRVGRWTQDLQRELGAEVVMLPLLSKESPKLYSSTGGAPYPVALMQEYRELTQVACTNSRKRTEVYASRPGDRSIASTKDSRVQEIDQKTRDFLQQRCRNRTF